MKSARFQPLHDYLSFDNFYYPQSIIKHELFFKYSLAT